MKKQSSYIFLQHTLKENKTEKENENENSLIVVGVGCKVYDYISRTFPSVKPSIDNLGIFTKQFEGKLYECSVVFTIHDVANIEYLDISIEGKTSAQIISCLEQIQRELFNSGIRNYYIDIVSYDAISEYYCNKMVVKLNTLERNLRKLMFNIYILNFGEDYYTATMSADIQDKIKKLINISTGSEQINIIKNTYGVSSKKQAEAIARLQQFFYSFELADMQTFLFKPNWTSIDENAREEFLLSHSDLSKLTDKELRTAFSQFTPKSDWDRFFSEKIPIDDITKIIDSIRKYRNAVVHFKHFDRNDYKCCNKLVRQLNNAVNEAIKITEDVDFAQKNSEMIKKAISGFIEQINNFIDPLVRKMQTSIKKIMPTIADAFTKLKTIDFPFIQSESDYDIEDDSQGNVDSDDANDDESDN